MWVVYVVRFENIFQFIKTTFRKILPVSFVKIGFFLGEFVVFGYMLPKLMGNDGCVSFVLLNY